VCSKNIANKAMASRISGPKILLLQCSIIYQRVEGKLLSLEPVIMQVNLVNLYSIQEVKIPGDNRFSSERAPTCGSGRKCKIVHRTGIFSFRVKCCFYFNKKLHSSSNLIYIVGA